MKSQQRGKHLKRKGVKNMTDKQAYKIIGERVKELIKFEQVQKKMLSVANAEGKESAEKYIYNLAIATLIKD